MCLYPETVYLCGYRAFSISSAVGMAIRNFRQRHGGPPRISGTPRFGPLYTNTVKSSLQSPQIALTSRVVRMIVPQQGQTYLILCLLLVWRSPLIVSSSPGGQRNGAFFVVILRRRGLTLSAHQSAPDSPGRRVFVGLRRLGLCFPLCCQSLKGFFLRFTDLRDFRGGCLGRPEPDCANLREVPAIPTHGV